jgi:hypothetical protein
MKITDKENFRQQLLKCYVNGLNEDELLVEAIATLESVFSYMNGDDVFKRSRPLAIAYVALCSVQNRLIKSDDNNDDNSNDNNTRTIQTKQK